MNFVIQALCKGMDLLTNIVVNSRRGLAIAATSGENLSSPASSLLDTLMRALLLFPQLGQAIGQPRGIVL